MPPLPGNGYGTLTKPGLKEKREGLCSGRSYKSLVVQEEKPSCKGRVGRWYIVASVAVPNCLETLETAGRLCTGSKAVTANVPPMLQDSAVDLRPFW